MTQQQIQQPYQQPYAQPPAQPAPQPAPQPYAPPYAGPYAQPMAPPYPGYPPVQPAPPQQPLAQGTLDDFYNQPSGGGGKSLSWKDKPEGTVYAGIVARDVNNGDVKQQTDFVSKAPLTYSDGRPKFTMTVPLMVQPSQEFPEGEAAWYVKGQARDELQRAMAEAGVSGAPKAGAFIEVRLVQRKPSSRGLNPTNVFTVRYVPDAGAAAPSPAAAPAPGASQPAPQHTAYDQVGGQPVQHQVPVQQAPQAQQQAVNQGQPQQWQQPQAAPQQPVFQPPQGPPPPAGMSEHQQALMAQLGAAQGQPQQ